MIDHIVAIASVGLAAASMALSTVFWFRSSVRKSYAAERDFSCLKRSYESLSTNVAHYYQMQDEKLDRLLAEVVRLQGTISAGKVN